MINPKHPRRVALFAACFLLVSAAVPVATADDVADEAELAFVLGADRYKAGDYIGALQHFLASNRLAPNRNVVFNIGRCYEQLKKYPDAFRFYTQALEGNEDKAMRTALEAAVTRIAPNVAILDVQSDPPGAAIYIDRKDLGARGSAPRKLGLSPGKYKVLLELPGHESATSAEITIDAGSTTPVKLTLPAILGSVTISGEAAGAKVRVDREDAKEACTIPCTLSLPPGRHTFFLSREGYQSTEVGADVTQKGKLELRPKMSVLTGGVVVNADVRDALIEIDGKPMGFTPAVLQVPVGKHTMKVSASGFRTITQPLEVKTGSQTKLDLLLTEVSEVTAASRMTESVEDAPASVSIIPKAELMGMGYPTIAEALRGTRGIYTSDDRSYVSLGFRGFSRVGDYGNRVLVMVDGMPTNDNWIGSSYVGFDGRTDLDDVERIEVVRGPGSVLYGTGAFFGVINLVTRSRTTPTHAEIGVSTAEHGVARGRASVTWKISDDAGVWTSISGAKGMGRDFYFKEFAATPTGGWARDLDGFEAATLSGRVWWKSLTLQWFLTAHKKTLPTAISDTIFGDPNNTFLDRRGFLEARFEPKLGTELQWLSRLHGNLYDFRGVAPYAPADGGNEVDTYRGRWVGFEQRFVYTPTPALRFTAGGEILRHLTVEQGGINEASVAHLAPPPFPTRNDPFWAGAGYLLADLSPDPALKISAGARLDWYETFGASINPRLAVITHPWEGGTIKVLGGKAFRAPSAYELYYVASTQIAPTGLKPEQIWSGEVEVSHRLSTTVTAAVAGFGNYVTDLVVLDGQGTSEDPNVYGNSRLPVLTLGAEAEVRRDFRQGWMLAGQVSIQRTRYLKNDDGFMREVPNSPWIMAGVKGAVPIIARMLQATTRVTLVGPRWDRNDRSDDPAQEKTDASLLWDVVLTGEAERGNVRWGLGVYNLFDYRWTAPVSREFAHRSVLQNGRTLYASLSTSF